MIASLANPLGLTLSTGLLVALAVLALMSPLLIAGVLWSAMRYSQSLMIASVVVLTLVPIVGFPSKEQLHPGVVGLMVLAYAALIGVLPRRRLRFTLIDVAALVVFAGCTLSYAYGDQTKTNFDHVLFLWFCPYFAARAITGSCGRMTVLKAFAVAGAIAIPFGIVEVVYGNLFLKAFPFGSDAEKGLGVATERLGINRAQGALGQPIPYAMFLAIAAVAAILLWTTREDRRSNRWLYIGLGIIAIQAATLARTGWLMLAIVASTLILFRLRTVFDHGNRRLIALVLVGAAVVFAVPQTNELLLGTSGKESTKIQVSTDYRSALIKQALEPGYIKPYGTTEPQIGPLGDKSIDDEYIHAAWTWGYLPLVGFALMFLAFVRGAWKDRSDIVALGVYATCIATMVALIDVAFLSQQEVLIWLLWGCASGLTVRPALRRARWARAAPPLDQPTPLRAAPSEGALAFPSAALRHS